MMLFSPSCASTALCGFVVNCLTEMSKLEAVNSKGWTGVVNLLLPMLSLSKNADYVYSSHRHNKIDCKI